MDRKNQFNPAVTKLSADEVESATTTQRASSRHMVCDDEEEDEDYFDDDYDDPVALTRIDRNVHEETPPEQYPIAPIYPVVNEIIELEGLHETVSAHGPSRGSQNNHAVVPGARAIAGILQSRASCHSTTSDSSDSSALDNDALGQIQAELVNDAEERERQAELESLRLALAERTAQDADIAVAVIVDNETSAPVEDEPTTTVQQKRRCVFVCLAFTVFVIGILAGITLPAEFQEAPRLELESSSPTSPTLGPTLDSTLGPTAAPTLANTTAPTRLIVPLSNSTSSPTSVPVCFLSRAELQQDVDLFLTTDEDSAVLRAAMLQSRGSEIKNWCVDAVEDFSNLFSATRNSRMSFFNERISEWDTSNAVSMSAMFEGASGFNQDLSNWDVSKVEDMTAMFLRAPTFNGNISTWDVSRVQSMQGMFSQASAFNTDISLWDTSSVTSMQGTFSAAISFDQELLLWDVSRVTDMYGLFNDATSFNQDLSGWDVSNVTTMRDMFNGATWFNQDLSNWDVSNVGTLWSMFNAARSFNQDLSNWNVSMSDSFAGMFNGATNFRRDLCPWGTQIMSDASVESMFVDTQCPSHADPVLGTDDGSVGPLCFPCT